MQESDFVISTLFLVFLMLFLLIGNSPALHRWLDRVTGMGRRERKEEPKKERAGAPETSREAKDYESIIFQQLALSGEKGLSPASLAGHLHFGRPMVEKALGSLKAREMIERGGLLGNRFRLSPKGREHAVREGIIPLLRSGSGE